MRFSQRPQSKFYAKFGKEFLRDLCEHFNLRSSREPLK